MAKFEFSLKELASLTRMQETELEKLVKGEDGEVLEPADFIDTLKESIKRKANQVLKDQAKRAIREEMERKAEAIKTKIKEVDPNADLSDLDTDDLVELAAKLYKPQPKQGEGTPQVPEELKKSTEALNEARRRIAELEKQHKTQTAEFEKRLVKSRAVERAMQEFLAANPILSTDEAKRARQLEMQRREFEALNYKEEGGKFVVVNAAGEVEYDEDAEIVDLKRLVSKSPFEFQTESGQQGANPAKPTPNGTPRSGSRKFLDSDFTPEAYQDKIKELKKAGDHAGIAEYERQYLDRTK